MEPAVSRQEMARFAGLKPCLRKPCPGMANCRHLHVSQGKRIEEINLVTNPNLDFHRRVPTMLGQAALWTNTTKEACTASTISEQEGPITKEITKEITGEEEG